MLDTTMYIRPRHTVIDLQRFVDSSDDFYVLGTGWQAIAYRQFLICRSKRVVAFIKNPLLPPLRPATIRHRASGAKIDFINSLIDQCESVIEDYVGDRLYGIEVLDPEVVDWKRARTIVCLQDRPLAVVSWLRERGAVPYVDFIAYPDMISWPGTAWEQAVGIPFFDYWKVNGDSFGRARDCFDDEASRALFDKVLAFRIKALEFDALMPDDQPESFDVWRRIAASYHETRDRCSRPVPGLALASKLMPQVMARFIRYFNPFGISPKILHRASWIISSGIFDHILHPRNAAGRVILDCGAFEGESSAALAWLYPQSSVYAFEPLATAFGKLEELAAKMPAIHPVNEGTWESSGTATLDDAGEGSRVSNDQGDGRQTISLISIDEFVSSRKLARVDAIKMNIEGAEMPSLRGAAETISRFRPSLSICSEHLPSDLWEIPTYLKQTHPQYSLSFMNFGPHVWASYVVGKAGA